MNHKNKDSSNTNFSSNYNKSEYEDDKNSLNDKKSSSSNNSESFNKNYKELKLRYEKRISTKKSHRSNTFNESKFTNSYNINTAEEIKTINSNQTNNFKKAFEKNSKVFKCSKEKYNSIVIKETLLEESDSAKNSKTNSQNNLLNFKKRRSLNSDNTRKSTLKTDSSKELYKNQDKIGKHSLKNPINIRLSRILEYYDNELKCTSKGKQLKYSESLCNKSLNNSNILKDSRNKIDSKSEYEHLRCLTHNLKTSNMYHEIQEKNNNISKIEINQIIPIKSDLNSDNDVNIFVNKPIIKNDNNIFENFECNDRIEKLFNISQINPEIESKNKDNDNISYSTPETSKIDFNCINPNISIISSNLKSNFIANSNELNRKFTSSLYFDKSKLTPTIDSKSLFFNSESKETNNDNINNYIIPVNLNSIIQDKGETNTNFNKFSDDNKINNHFFNKSEQTYNYHSKVKKFTHNNGIDQSLNFYKNSNLNEKRTFHNSYYYSNKQTNFKNFHSNKLEDEKEEFVINFHSGKNNIKRKYDTNEIEISKILDFSDSRTTVMIKNIPNKYTLDDLIEEVNYFLKNSYTHINLPLDYSVRKNCLYRIF